MQISKAAEYAQLSLICSKSTIKAQEKGVKYVQSLTFDFKRDMTPSQEN